MDKRVLRFSKFVPGLGAVIAVIFAVSAVLMAGRREYLGTFILSVFALLGIFLLVSYFRVCVVLREEDFEFRKLFRKSRRVRYEEVACILRIPLSSKVSTVLVGKQYQRIEGIDGPLIDMEPLFEALVAHGVPKKDFREMYRNGEDVSMYYSAMKWIESSYYKEQK